jgi:hypothetical protein
MDSNTSDLDLELIAALLDGRLSGDERVRAVKLLSDSDEALEIFAAASEQRQASESDDNVVPIPPLWRRWYVVVPVAAAAVLSVVFVPRLMTRRSDGVLGTQYASALSQSPRFATGLAPGWDEHGWTVTRGAEPPPAGQPPGGAAESKVTFRLGVRSFDLDVTLRRADTVAARRLTQEIVSMLGAVAYSESVSAGYNELASRLSIEPPAQSIERADAAERELRELLDGTPWYAFGVWTGAASLAAQLRDTSFFNSSHGASFIRSSFPSALSPEDSATLRLIDDRVRAGPSAQGFDDIRTALQATIRRRSD